MLIELSTTVVFERPHDVDLIKRWQLACEQRFNGMLSIIKQNFKHLLLMLTRTDFELLQHFYAFSV